MNTESLKMRIAKFKIPIAIAGFLAIMFAAVLLTEPDTSSIIREAIAKNGEGLSPVQLRRYNSWLRSSFRMQDTFYRLYESGAEVMQVIRGMETGELVELIRNDPIASEFWERNRRSYSNGYVDFVEQLVF